MITKTIEIRDAMTFIPAMAIKMIAGNDADLFLLGRAGFVSAFLAPRIMFVWIARGRAEWDPNAWTSRTIGIAHQYVQDHFDELKSGAVVDVEFILKITSKPKESERIEEQSWRGTEKKTDDTNLPSEG
jgi:hypothetical protein